MTVMTLSGSAGRAAERHVLGAVVRDDALQRLEVVHNLREGDGHMVLEELLDLDQLVDVALIAPDGLVGLVHDHVQLRAEILEGGVELIGLLVDAPRVEAHLLHLLIDSRHFVLARVVVEVSVGPVDERGVALDLPLYLSQLRVLMRQGLDGVVPERVDAAAGRHHTRHPGVRRARAECSLGRSRAALVDADLL